MADEKPIIRPQTNDSEIDRLRHDIDSGKTGDKVDMSDPSMAPLGTDDEAGQPPDDEAMRIARRAPPPPTK